MTTDDKITKETMERMEPRRTYSFPCGSVAEFQASLRHAYWVRMHHPRKDGLRYRISSNAASAVITIRVD